LYEITDTDLSAGRDDDDDDDGGGGGGARGGSGCEAGMSSKTATVLKEVRMRRRRKGKNIVLMNGRDCHIEHTALARKQLISF
jgi:hypothetical protein